MATARKYRKPTPTTNPTPNTDPDNAQDTAAAGIAADLVSLLERGDIPPWRKPWHPTGFAGHQNLFSGHIYTGNNPLLLELAALAKSAPLPLWCGFGEAKAHGLAVRRGARAARILRPQVHKADSKDDGTDSKADTEGRTWVVYKPAMLFNVTDLEGDGLQALIDARRQQGEQQQTDAQRIARADAILQAWPVPVIHGGQTACYSPTADRIRLPDFAAFDSPAAYYATALHECAHSTGHWSRLDRNLSGVFGSPSYAREELTAELCSVILGQRLQIGADLHNHAAYVNGWLQVLREQPAALLSIATAARKAADLICPDPNAASTTTAGSTSTPED
jgi:antirestriction protein ArdC